MVGPPQVQVTGSWSTTGAGEEEISAGSLFGFLLRGGLVHLSRQLSDLLPILAARSVLVTCDTKDGT